MTEPNTISIPTPHGVVEAVRLGPESTSAEWEATFPDGTRKSYFGEENHVRQMIELEAGASHDDL